MICSLAPRASVHLSRLALGLPHPADKLGDAREGADTQTLIRSIDFCLLLSSMIQRGGRGGCTDQNKPESVVIVPSSQRTTPCSKQGGEPQGTDTLSLLRVPGGRYYSNGIHDSSDVGETLEVHN